MAGLKNLDKKFAGQILTAQEAREGRRNQDPDESDKSPRRSYHFYSTRIFSAERNNPLSPPTERRDPNPVALIRCYWSNDDYLPGHRRQSLRQSMPYNVDSIPTEKCGHISLAEDTSLHLAVDFSRSQRVRSQIVVGELCPNFSNKLLWRAERQINTGAITSDGGPKRNV